MPKDDLKLSLQRRSTENGITSANFEAMDDVTRAWHLYSRINAVGGAVESLVDHLSDHCPAQQDECVDKFIKLEAKVDKIKIGAIICISLSLGTAIGMGVLNHDKAIGILLKLFA